MLARSSLALLIFVSAISLAAAQEIRSTALAAKSGPAGKTMFRLMPSEQTGISTENNYADPEMWGKHYQEFLFGGIGSGVAIGDFDGDGRPDIFVVSKTESCRLFKNVGGWKFVDVTDKAGVADKGDAAKIWKQGATFVDINNDGLLDIYVCRFNAPNLLYINQGDGTFKESAHSYGLDVVDACGMAAFCDYDRDGWLDVYITTNLLDSAAHPQGQRGYLFHNNRDGTFSNVTEHGGIIGESDSHSATWWDFDGDGWPDLYVANDYGVPDKLYHNNRDGTFTDVIAHALPHTSFSSMGSDVGDINNDGFDDFIVGDMATRSHELDQRGQAEERAKAKRESGSPWKYHRNALFLGTGTDRALEAAYLEGVAATDWTWALRFEDLDNDGWLDLFVTNGMNKEENIDVNSRMMQAETTEERIRIMKESPGLEQTHIGLKNNAGRGFLDYSRQWGLDQKGISFGAAFGDLDGDGDLDLVYINYQSGVTVLRNDSQEGHRVLIDLKGVKSNRYGVGAKVTVKTAAGVQARTLTLARGYMSSSEPVIHFGLGEQTQIEELKINWPSGQKQVFQNLASDRRYIITESESGAQKSSPQEPAVQFKEISAQIGLNLRWPQENVEETATQKLLPHTLNRVGPALAVSQSGPDAEIEIVAGGTTKEPAKILRPIVGGGQNYHAENLGSVSPVNDGPAIIFAASGADHADVLVTGAGNSLPDESPEYQPRLYIDDGKGGLTPAPEGTLPALPISVGTAAAADFLHEGELGLFLGARVRPGQYPSAAPSVLLANRNGHFQDVTASLAPQLSELGLVTSALWTDVDQDGWPDLVIALEWGPVKYFHNNSGKNFEDWSDRAGFSAAGQGWWTCVAAADFNEDGRLDYVVGNVGLNTQYHASKEHPAVLYAGDFRGDESEQLIEAYYEDNQLYPWRSRRDLGAAIPSVLKKFPKNDAYAKASLEEIFGVAKLNAAKKYLAQELRSGVFLSQPDGSYRFEALPMMAQIAPLQGIVAGDFDGDGHADIYAVQNSHAPVPSVGHFDGGLSQLLRGDGQGHFTAVPVAESGLKVPGDAKALVVADLNHDQWPDFVVSRNDEPLLAFCNQPAPGRHYLELRLIGAAANPNAIGSTATIVLSNGQKQTLETYAGGGYSSQSSPRLYFGYPDANPPVRVLLHWPNGSRSTVTLPNPCPPTFVVKQ